MKAAIFDLDGTLADSTGLWKRIDKAFCAKRGLILPPRYADSLKAMNFAQAAEHTVRLFGLKESPQAIMEEWDAMAVTAYARQIPLKPHAKEYLRRLRGEGVKLALATSATPRLYLPFLRRHGITDWFSAFATTYEVERGKGFPDVYLLAAARLGVPPEDCRVYEDILAGVLGARAAGMEVYGVYDAGSAGEREAILSHAARYVCDYAELLPEKNLREFPQTP